MRPNVAAGLLLLFYWQFIGSLRYGKMYCWFGLMSVVWFVCIFMGLTWFIALTPHN